MKKVIYILVVISLITISLPTIVQAKIYAVRDKLTGEPRGITSISDTYVNDWAKDFILTEVDESYQGKQHYELRYEGGAMRKATQQEIDVYKAQKETDKEAILIQKFLDKLDDDDIKQKIKDIKNL